MRPGAFGHHVQCEICDQASEHQGQELEVGGRHKGGFLNSQDQQMQNSDPIGMPMRHVHGGRRAVEVAAVEVKVLHGPVAWVNYRAYPAISALDEFRNYCLLHS